jgi:excisionase family DNA binding protein
MSTSAQYISVREAAQILNISEKKIMDLIEEGKLQAYRIADKFLRLKRAEVLNLRNTGSVVKENNVFVYTPAERIRDFLYFNDFYIIAALIILSLLYIIFFK